MTISADMNAVLHHDNVTWENQSEKWKNELNILESQLSRISDYWPESITVKGLCAFRNQAKQLTSEIREFILHIEDHESQLVSMDSDEFPGIGDIAVAVHHNLKTRFQELQKEYHLLSEQSREYLANNY